MDWLIYLSAAALACSIARSMYIWGYNDALKFSLQEIKKRNAKIIEALNRIRSRNE